MDQIANLNWIEGIGWLASLITIASYSVSTMLPLRFLAITSSLCFATYAFILHLWPLLAMELILLPINLYRFWQVLSLRRKVSTASGAKQADFSVIKTYGKRSRFDAGSAVFERGDLVDQLYYLAKGRIKIEDFGIDLAPGDVFGEIAFFADAATRTATARCTEDAEVYGINEKQFMRLQFEDPSFGLAIMRTMTRRLMANVNSASGTS
ncbi:Cyclic nucleotide-binding domain-containing protein [Aliiroseovarius sediminilitoris]|uniref:Cyclic nucleotide-binding domain-containing protein n=1 Tax=Aliiroseovarius sediminilitoris TaxID=1173584 RepID=A0A1I0RAA5_9RHOB|nr:Crp/Fnr family transcriptional regulator [Aliiroseovarius sediminilitoris]SEW37757.1 Cyclic nucleotide-binding domain-containing protein [Aliiroseovarius sediminilitoris]